MLLQVAAGTRLLDDTAALNITYTASVAAVDAITPNANHGSSCHTALSPRFKILSRQLLWRAFAPPLNPGGIPMSLERQQFAQTLFLAQSDHLVFRLRYIQIIAVTDILTASEPLCH